MSSCEPLVVATNESRCHISSDAPIIASREPECQVRRKVASQPFAAQRVGEAKKKKIEATGGFDPWALTDLADDGTPWNEKRRKERITFVVLVCVKSVLLIFLLYLFICSLDMLGSAFQLVGGKAAGDAFTSSVVMSNPVACLVLGIIATLVVQSSSTSTSIVVSMVASDLLKVQSAVFIIMGTNIGTSVTSTIVAMSHVGNKNEFRRAFAGATLHDVFNWLAVFSLMPIEWISSSIGPWRGCGMLCQISAAMAKDLKSDGTYKETEMLGVITKPLTKLIIQIDKDMLHKIAMGQVKASEVSLLKRNCGPAVFDEITGKTTTYGKCHYLFEFAAEKGWSDLQVGICVLIISLVILCACLALIVKLLHSLLKGQIAKVIKRIVNAEFPGRLSFLTGYVSICVGAGITILLQSSSIFTSALTPLVGIGVLHLKRMYPLTLGANIGTTFTAVMAALASSREKLQVAIQIALCHLLFNLLGILVWYPVPFMRKIPIRLAMGLGDITAEYRWFSIAYMIFMFFILPATVFGLSLAGWEVFLGIGLPIFLFLLAVVIINILQRRRPNWLPVKLQTWDWLPEPLHSLAPYDAFFSKICCCIKKKVREEQLIDPEKQSSYDRETVAGESFDSSPTQVSIFEGGMKETIHIEVCNEDKSVSSQSSPQPPKLE